jgi:TatD DNase family protein
MELTDSHCHIQSIGLSGGDPSVIERWGKAGITDPDEVIARAHEASVTRLVCVGCSLSDSQLATEFVGNRNGCWAAIGLHPHETDEYAGNKQAYQEFAALVRKPKVVAIGECGLDYHYMHSPKSDQETVLRFQIELAMEHNLPLIFHVRDAFDDFWPIFESYRDAAHPIRGVVHSFTDNQANLERALSHDLLIGVNGIATFTKDSQQFEIYRTIPDQFLVLETDAPFLTPTPFRGRICEPYHIQTIAEFLAQLRGQSVSTLADVTTRNAAKLFSI